MKPSVGKAKHSTADQTLKTCHELRVN